MKVGDNVLVMTPTTHYWMGHIVEMDLWSITLDDAAWIPQIGRHHEVLSSGLPDESTEIEPHPPGMLTAVPRAGSVVILWPHPLWRTTK